MRQQYHSRKIGDDCLIWDVNALVELVADFPVIDVSVSAISELDENYWYQGDDDVPTCKDVAKHAALIEETDLEYPIILCSKGRVMDGMHRVCKAHMLGHEKIKAVQFESDPEPHYKNIDMEELPYEEE